MVKINNGLIINWGQKYCGIIPPNSVSSYDVDFPISFTQKYKTIGSVLAYGSWGQAHIVGFNYDILTKLAWGCWNHYSANGELTVAYIAIGY